MNLSQLKKSLKYQVVQVESEYQIVNNETHAIQSAWVNKADARDACVRLNNIKELDKCSLTIEF